MARVRVTVNRAAIEKIKRSPEVVADLARRADAIADACNRDSSWGGYESEVDVTPEGVEARVWDFAEPSTDTRRNRLLRNLDAGR